MGKLIFTERAWNEYLYWQKQDKKTLKRINALLKDIDRGSFEGIGKPEPLKNHEGFWSRRIDYISLTDIAKYKSENPAATIQNWMRSRDVIEFWGYGKLYIIRILNPSN